MMHKHLGVHYGTVRMMVLDRTVLKRSYPAKINSTATRNGTSQHPIQIEKRKKEQIDLLSENAKFSPSRPRMKLHQLVHPLLLA